VAPRLADLATPQGFIPANIALLSNTSIGNFFDLCSISVPLPVSGLPVGLMLLARNGRDEHLFRAAAGMEHLFA
jgi:aspartyl-tRNA(Asn)/glutamyl-tRNA(Gln) amidotransferase subunit A